jgi:DNA mismatch repair protein MutL
VSYAPAAPSSVPLSGPAGARRSLRLLGQYKGSLLLLEAPEGLLLVDQHAAHERVLYEELATSLAQERPPVQRLLTPRLLELGPAESMRLAELAPALEALGFPLQTLSGGDLALGGVPAPLSEEEAIDVLSTLAVEGDGDGESDPAAVGRRILEALAASNACRGAIKIHRPLPWAEQETLVSRLLACDQPYACPHGRPTMLKMTDGDLERRFGRRG